ncbi:SH3 domain-containing protein [Streptomyces sp. NPDC018029]|uniref:SH3 domain-containing protein n=1 Tax=Streptomyces sp. NPDC018029 TaxID=3365032 RepID=UPI0037B9DBBD
MSLRTTAIRLGTATAGCALAALAVTGPAAALDDHDNATKTSKTEKTEKAEKTAQAGKEDKTEKTEQTQKTQKAEKDQKVEKAESKPPVYKGRVTARSGLLLRTSPTRGSKVVRSVPYGKVVTIFCRTKGDRVVNNNVWYLLTDGTWAWGSAHYIANIGKVPRWC